MYWAPEMTQKKEIFQHYAPKFR